MELQLDNGEYQVVFKDSNLSVAVEESAPLNVVVGENANIEVGEALHYIKTGTAEIDAAVQEGLVLIGEQVDRAESYAESAAESAEMAYRYRSTYIHEQGVASSEWVINHNLNKFPSVTVVDSADNEIIVSVRYVDANTCVIDLTSPFKGKAYLN